ncbi:uncharacterized protein A4U43_C04F22610 [Asparagus officinalis]|uniref:CHCH domain-containing protein n=1 Tax=Asparagus officinalis TaxID=4686 RepID=A0A5P1F4R7_ASPOF|nr:uncharacterized protein LOC109837775 [Asparagus officinalis]ONK72733.1 uncharacterized protein A4U43_C04F22610 [Asparagus officinalis]
MGDSYTIQISSNLVNKLARDGEGRKRRTKKSKPKIPEIPNKSEKEPTPSPAAPKTGPSSVWPVQTPVFMPVPDQTPGSAALTELETIRSRIQESENVVKKLEQKELNMTKELNQRAKELRDKEFKLPYQKSMPCGAEREACLQCYQENLKQPLQCAEVVRTFNDCARRARQQQVNGKV